MKLPQKVQKILPEEIAPSISKISGIQEIRLRIDQPIQIITDKREGFFDPEKGLVSTALDGLNTKREQIEEVLLKLSGGSYYTIEDSISRGYVTLPGGHRVGLAGQVVSERGKIKNLFPVGSLNVRIAREFPGVACRLLPYLVVSKSGSIRNTLFISPPAAGKTTMLRDLIRLCSYGEKTFNLCGGKVGVVDERGELAGTFAGCPQLDVGPRTDVLDGVEKKEGLFWLLRSMSPEVLACDELGSKEDAGVVSELARAGVKFLTTLHGSSWEEINIRPVICSIVEQKFFSRYVFLTGHPSPGSILEIRDEEGKIVFCRQGEKNNAGNRVLSAAGRRVAFGKGYE